MFNVHIVGNFDRFPSSIPSAQEVCKKLEMVLRLIADMKCNKETAVHFGERVEDIVSHDVKY